MSASRRFLLPALLAATALFATACGGGGAATTGPQPVAGIEEVELTPGVEIDFWHIQATVYGEAITEMVAEFNATNEWGIVVNEAYKGSYQELNQAIRAALAGGGAPDVAMAYENDTLEYVDAGEIVPLDTYLDSPTYGVTEEDLADIVPGVLARQRVDAYEGQTLSWPHGNSSLGLYYNADVFAAAGITAPPADWDEFVAQARQVKERTGLTYVSFGSGKNGTYYNIARSKGLTPFDPVAGTVSFTAPESIEALELLALLYTEQLAYTAEDTEQEFTNVRTATEMGTTARTATKIEQIGDRFDWRVALTPQETAEPITQLFGGNHVMLNSEDPQQQLASWLFMRWFADTQAQSIYAARTGYSPAVVSALDTELLTADYQANPQKAEVFANVFPNAQILPPTSAGNAIDSMVSGIVEEVTLGRIPPQEAAERMDAEAGRLLAAAN